MMSFSLIEFLVKLSMELPMQEIRLGQQEPLKIIGLGHVVTQEELE
jgi:hypothetical protein